MKTILQLFVFFICISALYAEEIPITITYFRQVGTHLDQNFRYIIEQTPSDLYVLHEARLSYDIGYEQGIAMSLKKDNTLLTNFITPYSMYPGEKNVPPVFFDTTKLRLKWYKKDEDMNALFFPMDFYILNKSQDIIDSIRLFIMRAKVPHEEYDIKIQNEMRKYIDPNQKTLIKYEINGIDIWNVKYDGGNLTYESEREGDTLISAQSISHRWIRDSLGDNFYDPFGTNWDNFNPDFAHLYDNCIVSHRYPACNFGCSSHNGIGWKMMVRRHIAVHNGKAAANFRQLSVIGNNGDKRRYGRGLWDGVEDTIPATDKEIEFYRALMCVCPTLPIQQKLVFNDLTNVEENTSLIESTVYPNPSSRYFTVQGQAFTQIYVYDILGTLIEQSVIDGAGQWKNNPTLYTNGYYTVQLRHSDGRMENLSVIMFQ
ncbi:MAG: T9SS type A sorting domain-containing protein [Candidatus Kapaibacterium sp.]|jgi:hypothetical protein